MSILPDLMKRHPQALTAEKAKLLYQQQPSSYREAVDESTFIDFFTTRFRDVLFGHDYEASDADGATAAPLQIAGVYTDSRFRPLDLPVEIFCQLHGDKLPAPMAIEITRIAPSHVIAKGEPEPVFFRRVNQLLSLPGTCSYGYNSIRYDDKVTRFGLFRNLLPPYAREFQNGNSRWDAMHVTLAFYVNHKDNDAIVWPQKEAGGLSFKLEHLCEANGITQEQAHNAVDDVKAMVGWLAKLRQVDPALMDYCFSHRKKRAVQSVVYPGSKIYLPSFFAGEEKNYCFHLLVLGSVPGDKNKYFGVDIRDIESLRTCFKLSPEEIKERLYMTKEALDDAGMSRPPLVSFAINQAPPIMTETTPVNGGMMPPIPSPPWEKALLSQRAFLAKLAEVLTFDKDEQPSEGVETCLYGGFPSDHDSGLQERVRDTALPEAYTELPAFEASHFNELHQRILAKLSPSLTPEWAKHRRQSRDAQLAAWYPDVDDKWSAYWNDVDAIITDETLRDDIKQTVQTWLLEESRALRDAEQPSQGDKA